MIKYQIGQIVNVKGEQHEILNTRVGVSSGQAEYQLENKNPNGWNAGWLAEKFIEGVAE